MKLPDAAVGCLDATAPDPAQGEKASRPRNELPPQEPPVELHPRLLVPATVLPFDLYAPDPDGGLRPFRRAGDILYVSVWRDVEQEGIALLYADPADRAVCARYIEQHLDVVFGEPGLPTDHAARWLRVLADDAMQSLLARPRQREKHERVGRLVRALATLIGRDSAAAAFMLAQAPVRHRTHTHSVNVSVMLADFARRFLDVRGCDAAMQIALGGVLHDLGKTAVPARILDKPASLTAAEFEQMAEHPRCGLDLARPYLNGWGVAAQVIAQHHENMAGNGYPDGRSGDAIHVLARAARVADAFDALTSERPYGRALDQFAALRTMTCEMPGAFDPDVLRAFIRYVGSSLGVVARRAAPRQRPSAPPAEMAGSRALAAFDQPADLELMDRVLGVACSAAAQSLARRAEPEGQADDGAPAEARKAAPADMRRMRRLLRRLEQYRTRFARQADESEEAVLLRRAVLSCLGSLRQEVGAELAALGMPAGDAQAWTDEETEAEEESVALSV